VPVWAIKGASRLPAITEAKACLKNEEQRELGRLLYVAMTRARDRLCITGSHKGDLPAGCWYETVKSALVSAIEEEEDFQGRAVWRFGSLAQTQSLAPSLNTAPDRAAPAWLGASAPGELALPILSPSRIFRESDELHASGKPVSCDRNLAKTKGVLIHRLLEVLPQLPAAERASAATAIASAFAAELSGCERETAIECAFAALSSELFLDRNGQSMAEAGIAVTLLDYLGKRRGIIAGQVDRILFDEAKIQIWDYKSGVVHADAGLSVQHVAQLAAYRLALSRLYPNMANIHAALLNTRSMNILRTQDSMLDAFLEQFASEAQG
jgi:ATP-dependent helicase/nuclease subunit A